MANDLAPLYAALATARDKCGSVEKDAHNDHFRYRYASSEAVIGEAREALATSGLSFVPFRTKLDVIGGVSEHGEVVAPVRVLARTFLLAHASGATLEIEGAPWPIVLQQGRPLDKALAIAVTTQLSYALRDLLLMRRGGDDQDEHEPDEKPALAPPRAKAQTRPETGSPAPAPATAAAASPAPSAQPKPAPAPAAAPGPVASKDSTLAAALPSGTQAARVLEAPAATPATNGAALVGDGSAGPSEARLAEDERLANKLGDEHWELAQPLCDGPLDEQKRDLAKSLVTVAANRFGGVAKALEALAKIGVAPRAVPARAQLRELVKAMPESTVAAT